MGGSEAAVLDEKLAGEGHAVPDLFGVEVGELDHHARAPVVDRGDAEALELGARLGGGLGEGTDVQRRGIGGGGGGGGGARALRRGSLYRAGDRVQARGAGLLASRGTRGVIPGDGAGGAATAAPASSSPGPRRTLARGDALRAH